MILADLKKGDKIYETLMSATAGVLFKSEGGVDPIIFDHVDGMYSYCYLESDPKKVIHITAAAPLVKYKDGYRLKGAKDEK